jgi:hypothetical protein
MGLWRLVVFGELVPNTFAAKSGGTSLHLEHGLSYVGEALVEYPLALLAPLALLLARKRELAVLGAATAVWVAFVVRAGGDHFSYSRLLAPVLIPASMLAVAGLTSLAVSRGRLWLAAVPILPFAAWTHTDKDLAPEHGFANVAQWVDVGRWIAAERPGSTAATVPIGAIGWFCECELIDLVGLTEPAIAHAGRSVPEELFVPQWIGHERHNTEYVLSREPDLIVTNKWRLEPWTLEESRAGFYASWLLLQEVKEGRAPYRVLNAEVAEGVYWLLLERDPH